MLRVTFLFSARAYTNIINSRNEISNDTHVRCPEIGHKMCICIPLITGAQRRNHHTAEATHVPRKTWIVKPRMRTISFKNFSENADAVRHFLNALINWIVNKQSKTFSRSPFWPTPGCHANEFCVDVNKENCDGTPLTQHTKTNRWPMIYKVFLVFQNQLCPIRCSPAATLEAWPAKPIGLMKHYVEYSKLIKPMKKAI